MGASDYMVGNAPGGASYAAPLVGFQLGQELAGLPDQYMKGRESSRKIQMEDMFKGGMPKNEDGSPDVNAIMDKGAKIGGLPFAQSMLPFLQQMSFAKSIGEGMNATDRSLYGGGGTAPPPGRPATTPNAAGPSNLAPQPQGGQPQLSATGGDIGNQGAPTLRSTVAKLAGGKDVSPGAISAIARQMRLNPDATLSDAQIRQVEDGIRQTAQASQPPGSSEDVTPRPEDSSANERAMNGPSAAPSPAGGVSGAPAPSQGGAGFQERFTGQQPSGVPAGVSEASAQRYERAGAHVDNLAAQAAAAKNPELSAALKQRAQSLYDIAKQQREQLGKAAELTPAAKDARDAAVADRERRKAVQEGDIKVSEKAYAGLQNLGQVGQIGNQKLDRIRSVMSDPDFMSGAGNKLFLAFKQWNATLGGNPNAAQPMEEFNKTAQQLLTDDIKAMGQSGAGPVRVAEVQIMKQATANLGISPATNRYLVEEAYRLHNDNIAVARLAQEYKAKNGFLDAGWDKIRDQYYQQHPLFSKEELADPRLVSPPMLLPVIAADPVKAKAWEKAQGLKSGDPIKTEDGKIRWVR